MHMYVSIHIHINRRQGALRVSRRNMHTYLCNYTHIHTHTHIHSHTQIHIHRRQWALRAARKTEHSYLCIYTHTHIRTHIYTHIQIHVYIHRRQWALRAARRNEGPNVSNQKLLNMKDGVIPALLQVRRGDRCIYIWICMDIYV